ncbi:type IV toxin-antitoxin system AbiEi family antitoxin domain-containing protein [Gordonia sp. VNK21]|uniref:type IV toxin-antitoxin system AbiEi family antitoxin domain-containing protein n=1 Tax=Gordonia sp. VNK21 TaxID=3382483 RepID=UPI0038D3BDAC
MGDTGEIARLLAAQDGIVTARQAAGHGLSRDRIRGRVGRGEWIPVARGVYRSAGHEFTEAALVRAVAAAHCGIPDRLTACWWHGLIETLPAPLTIAVTGPVRTDRWPGCEVRALRRRIPSQDRCRVRGLEVTAPAWSLLGSLVLLDDASRVLDRALQQGAVTLAQLRATLERNAGAAGLAGARRLVAALDGDTESDAERTFAGLLRGDRITGWVQQLPFGRWRIDFAWPELKVAVEIDGWAFHRDHRRFRSDIRKRNQLIAAGWLPLTFSWHDLQENPVGCLELLVRVLRERASTLG